MRVLVTGGAGFIGSRVAKHLLARGHQVAIVDDLSSGKRENIPEGVRFWKTDIRGGCADVFDDFRPEVLSHQAAQMDVRRSVREPDFDASVNVVGTVRLLENCAKHGVRKVVFASTGGAIYGEQREFPATEDHPLYPVSPYGVSKLAGERYLHYYEVQYGLPYVALRYANVYGPHQDPHGEAGVVAIFCGNLAEEKVSRINGAGTQTRDYVYVEDVARATLAALDGGAGGVFNVGTGTATSVVDLYEICRSTVGTDAAPVHEAARPGELGRSVLDGELAATTLGFRPETALASGIAMTWESIRSAP
jgi:UDP-glucose 4-epimerase